MVNGINSNYNVQGVSYNPPLYNVNTNSNTQQITYNNSDNVNVNKMQSGNVPSSGKLSFWDRITSNFKDVHQSPQNINAYKVFQNSIKSNPEGYLLPGSSDTNKVKDLQHKLSMVGFKLNVNGQFGHATEQAVIQFKKSVGINDGYLDKNGNFAVTPIVTPKTWELLNAQVAFKLNPNGYNGNYYNAPPVTQEELKWAKNLQTKIRAGYQPTQSERIRYENIYNRQQLALQSKQQNFVPPDVPPPTPEDIEWAKQLVNKIQTLGYKPNPSEIQRYQEIYNKQKQSRISQEYKKNNPSNTNSTQNTNTVTQEEINWAKQIQEKVKKGQQVTPQEEARYEQIRQKLDLQNNKPQNNTSKKITQDEFNWAKNLEDKVNNQGYIPTNEEKAKYEDIFNRYKNQGVESLNNNDNVSKGVTQDEFNWAKNLENKVNNQGYIPTNEEKAKYEDIFNRYQKEGLKNQQNTNNSNSTPPKKPSEKDLEWALDLEKRTRGGYQPSEMELQMYNDIVNRYQYYQQQEKNSINGATPDEMAWAANMYTKMQNGYRPTAEELSILNNIQSKISGTNKTNSISNSNGNRPKIDFNPQGEFSYSNSNIQAFRNAFSNYNLAGGRVPYLSYNDGNNVARQYGFSSVEDLQSTVGAVVDGKFGPETYFKLAQYLNNGGIPSQTSSTKNRTRNDRADRTENDYVSNNNFVNSSGGVTQEELDWAVNLQSRYSQGYKASKQEMDKYTDIYNRYEASGNKVINSNGSNNVNQTNFNTTSSNAPTQEEIAWAQNLQDRIINQGYKATQQEIDRYTDIYNRLQISQGQNNNTQLNTSNVPTVSVNVANNDPDLQWALQLLDKVQNQGYNPTEEEIQKYEQVIARNQTVAAYP